jgi:hypothetical protein
MGFYLVSFFCEIKPIMHLLQKCNMEQQECSLDVTENDTQIPETTPETTTEKKKAVSQPLGEKPQETPEIEYIPAGQEYTKPKKPTRKQNRTKVKTQLSKYFSDLSGIPILPVRSKRDGAARAVRWWKPLMLIYDQVGGDMMQAREIIKTVFHELDDAGMTIAAPQGILQNALGEIGKRNRAKNGRSVIEIGG